MKNFGGVTLKKLKPEKLSVEFRQGVTETQPIIPRRYTLTHSDITGELFLTLGLRYAYDKINIMRDEVLGEWFIINNKPIFSVDVHVDGKPGYINSAIRNKILIRELPLALQAIRYGDRAFFKAHPELDKTPIMIHFNSKYPYFNRIEYWGTLSDYILNHNRFNSFTFKNNENIISQIYSIALDSYISTYDWDIINIENYIAVDMSTEPFKKLSEKDKQVILEHLKKYNLPVMEESYDTLKEKGFVEKKNGFDYIDGILLVINKIEIKNANEIIVEGLWFTGTIAGKLLKSTIVYKDNEWQLKEVKITGFI